MIDCGFVQENLSVYIDEELDSDQGRQIQHHLQTCQVCNKEYTELLITATIMRSLSEIEPPPGIIKERVKERLLNEGVSNPVSRIKRVKWYSFGAVAAGLLLLLGSWNFLFDGGLAKFPADTAGTQEIAMEMPASEERDAVKEELMAEPFTMAAPEAGIPPEEQASLSIPQETLEGGTGGVDADVVPDPAGQLLPGENGKETAPPEQVSLTGQYDYGVGSTPAEAEEISIASVGAGKAGQASPLEDEKAKAEASRMMTMSVLPPGQGLRLELELKTQDLSQTHKAIERIAQVHQLEVLSQENDQVLLLEVVVPISQQGEVLEELKGLGHVTGETASDPDLGRKIAALISGKRELVQQQIELRALISNGGTPENMEAWRQELSAVTEEVEKIAAQITELEAEHGPTSIKVILVK